MKNAIVRVPATSFASGLTTSGLGSPDLGLALEQHALYCEALERCGLSLTRLGEDARFPDSTFVEDTAIVTPRGALCTRPGAPSRAGEVAAVDAALAPFFPSRERIAAPGTLDGGDVLEAGDRFFIGVSHRTNEEGARQLAAALEAWGFTATAVDIRGIDGLLHLKSGVSWLGNGRLAVVDELAAHAAFRGFEKVGVPGEEAYAANCVKVNGTVLVASGFPRFRTALETLGETVVALPMSEFRKMDGGLSCLSLRF